MADGGLDDYVDATGGDGEAEEAGRKAEPPVDLEDVTVLVPTLNEAATIGEVVSGYLELGFDDVFVIDGGSADGTRETARENGARVVRQSGVGKGQAFREALSMVDRRYVLMVDGDGTYGVDDAFDVLAPLAEDVDHVIGDRLGNPEAFSRLNYVGNRIFNLEFRLAHGYDLRDILSGYRAFRTESVRRMRLREDGFGIETEMSAETVRLGQRVAVVSVDYRPRPDGSREKLRPVRDGARIGYTVYRTTRTSNPGFYFGVWGALSAVAGVFGLGYLWVAADAGVLPTTVTFSLLLAAVVLFAVAGHAEMTKDLHDELLDRL
ncbi:MAG: S-layer glycoprotein N-glycosyltransferase AglJ [Halobacteriales archaeon]